MAQDNLFRLKELPYYSVSAVELKQDFAIPAVTEAAYINNDFLEDIKKMYRTELLNSLKFNYFTPDAFNDMISKENDICLSLFHMNIRSLNKNNEELSQFLNTLNHNFDVLVLSEVWSHNIALYNNLLPGYNFYCDLPLSSDVGGVGIYVKSSLLHCIVSSYNIVTSIDCPVENLWLEVTKNSSKYIIGGVYRHPGYKISKFIEQMDNTLTQISNCKTPCFIAGDINIDLKKYQYHQDTKVYLDTLIMNNFTPVVVMPTRITDRSATLIDHICYSDCGKHNASSIITGGNLWCDITDHLPNFVFST